MGQRYKDDTFHMMETFAQTVPLKQGFPKLENPSQSVQMRGKMGSTWDAKHMTNFLSQSNYSNWSGSSPPKQHSHKRALSSNNYFFKTTKDNKNASKIGYTQVNPLVSLVKTNSQPKEKIKEYLKKASPERYVTPPPAMQDTGKFKFQGNTVKFRSTDPLTLQHEEHKAPTNFDKERLMRLIHRRHPHGMTGIDHSESPQPHFYSSASNSIRIREEPNSRRTFVLDREWKSKGRVSNSYKDQYGFIKGNTTLQRKFRNENTHGYNIINHCHLHEGTNV